MRQKTIYPVWGILYILCVLLGLITDRNLAVNIVFTVISVGFFIPGVLLLVDAYRENDRKARLRLRYVCLTWLVLTLALLVANFASAGSSSYALGDVLYYILAVVSAPMFCSSAWILTIFLWACLFIASFPRIIGK